MNKKTEEVADTKKAEANESASSLLDDFWAEAEADTDANEVEEADEEAGEEVDEEADEGGKEESDAVEEVRRQMTSMIQGFQDGSPQLKSIEEELLTAAPQPKPQAKGLELEAIELFKPEDVEEGDPVALAKKLNDALNKVRIQTIQDTIRTISPSVTRVINDSINLQMGVADFYRKNQDLIRYKPYVAMRATQLVAQNPNMPLDQLFTQLERAVRTELNLKVTSNQPAKKKTFVKSTGLSSKRREVDTRSARQRQIDEILRNR